MSQPTLLSRRSVIKGAAWSIPVVAVAVAAPRAAASDGTGGTLFIIGNAYANAGIYLAGTNYNGFGSTVTYPVNSLRTTILLPEIDGIADTLVSAAPAWTAFRVSNVVTLMNAIELAPGAETGDIGDVSITGPFPAGSTYTISVVPDSVNVAFEGNLGFTGTF